MCVLEQWYNIYPDNTYILQERFHPCHHHRTPGHRTELRTLQNEWVPPPSPVRPEIEVIAPSRDGDGSHASITETRRPKKRGKEGLRLDFNWHIPFTSKKERRVIEVRRPASRPASRPITPPLRQPEPATMTQPYARSPRQDMRPPQYVWTLPPEVFEISPREVNPREDTERHEPASPPPPPPPPLPPLQQSQTEAPLPAIYASRVHTRRAPPQAAPPRPQRSASATRVHSRHATAGTSARAPSPLRRNHSPRRVRQVDDRIRRLESDLQEARRTVRLERINRLLREIELERTRRDEEIGRERRHQGQEESRRHFERGREVRMRHDRQRPVEVHQNREDSIEDRGARVLHEAVRNRHLREDGEAADGRLARRASMGGVFRPFRRRDNRARGEEVIWNDDFARIRRRWI
ncbi:hypothetical protein MMC14_005305 [Varicellaria rhodocarpa]|nr:hypothetical protein [Varicellaria rhodocarpa]